MYYQDCRNARKTPTSPYGMAYPASPMMQPVAQQPMYGQQPMYAQPGYTQPGYAPQTPYTQPGTTAGAAPTGPDAGADPVEIIQEQSYIENILRYNKGRIGTFYMTFENNTKWNAMRFRGRVETAARDHFIISDPETGKRYLLLLINLNWAEFDGEIAYPNIPIPPQVQPFLTTNGGTATTGTSGMKKGR